MLIGIPPFYNTDRKKIYTAILEEQPKFYSHVSKTAKDLISKLLIKDPKDRLGSKYGFREIKKHSFFKNVKWDEYLTKSVKPPFIPNPRNIYFSDEFINIPIDKNFANENVSQEFTVIHKDNQTYDPENRIQLEFSYSHDANIQNNRKAVEQEFETWYQDVGKPNIKSSENSNNDVNYLNSDISYEGRNIILKKLEQHPAIKITNSSKLRPCSPNSSCEMNSFDSKQMESSPKDNEMTNILLSSPDYQQRFQKYTNSHKMKNVTKEIYFVSVTDSLKNIEHIDIDELISGDNALIETSRKRVIPDYAYIDEDGIIYEKQESEPLEPASKFLVDYQAKFNQIPENLSLDSSKTSVPMTSMLLSHQPNIHNNSFMFSQSKNKYNKHKVKPSRKSKPKGMGHQNYIL